MAANELKVLLTGDASRLSASLNTASSKLKGFGKSVKNIGSSLQRFSLPLALAGGAAVKMGADFDKSMTQIKALVGVAGAEVDKMGESARKMAVETGVSSKDAADALFFITSAGLRGSEAMEVLNASLKASAVGLGETKIVADLATSAMNAYGSEVLSATGATDVLVSAVREGKLEASELSAAMGSVLPTASNMGVKFHEVGAAFAAMSRTGTGASEAATQLNSILMAIMKPTTQSAGAMDQLGLSSEGLRKQIKEKGLLSVFETLKVASEQNSTAFETVFGNVRALKGVMDLLGAGVESTRTIFASMNKTQGATTDAFNETAKSASFQLTASLNKAKESFAQMGAIMLKTMLPLFQDIAAVVAKVFNAFNNLDGATQKLVLGIGALIVALPTILTLVGTLTTIVGALLSPVGLVAAALAAVAYVIYKNWAEVAPVVVGLYNQFVDLYNSSEALRVVIGILGATFKSVFIGVKAVVDGFVNTFTTMWNVIKTFSEKGVKGAFGDILQEGFENGKKITEKAGEDIGNAYSDAIAGAVKSRLEKKTVEQLNASLTNIGNKAKGLISGIFSGGGGVGGGQAAASQAAPVNLASTFASKGVKGEITSAAQSPLTGVVEQMNIDLEGMAMAQEKYEANLQRLEDIGKAVGQSVAGAFSNMTGSMIDSLGLADTGMQGFLKNMAQMVTDLIAMMLAASIAEAIKGGSAAGMATGAAAVFTTPAFIATAVGGIMGAFAAIPAFANGGIVSGPTMGLMGEYPGAKSNPEVIAPLNKLKNLMGEQGGGNNMNVSGEFVVRGQDLVVALQRADKTRSRIK